MESSTFMKQIDINKKYLANIKEFELKTLSRAGNNLSKNFYEKIKDKLNNITEIINIQITSMNNIVLNKVLTDIFDSNFSLNSIEIFLKENNRRI